MRLKLIACNVFMREACHSMARSPHVIDVEFTELGDHVHSETLRTGLQARIDAAGRGAKPYDAILLLFGICGNATIGLRAGQTQLVLPRAHDCCTILLGSKERFRENFEGNPSMPFSSAGYLERGDYFMRVEDGENRMHYGDAYANYVQQYGEENAKYIWETMHPQHAELANKAFFIDLPETAHLHYREKFQARARAEGKDCVVLQGSMQLINRLLTGDWTEPDFLVVPSGHQVRGVYDWVEVIRSEPHPGV
jgi:hypothetical protein